MNRVKDDVGKKLNDYLNNAKKVLLKCIVKDLLCGDSNNWLEIHAVNCDVLGCYVKEELEKIIKHNLDSVLGS